MREGGLVGPDSGVPEVVAILGAEIEWELWAGNCQRKDPRSTSKRKDHVQCSKLGGRLEAPMTFGAQIMGQILISLDVDASFKALGLLPVELVRLVSASERVYLVPS